ncbi:MAG: Diaminopimelate epimerase [Alphaproteobacteria bacterium MarineAlpha2_Bin1]|nr:MAG: Diaminopimelate epimerase [Alphaproteobacteria bacterium MarineAlpha2_Bin1]
MDIMGINFTKMHGLGNDFVIIDALGENFYLDRGLVCKISDRKKGVGCDQVLLLRNSDVADAEMVVFNSDGTISEACGNGARCVAKYLANKESKFEINLLSGNRILHCDIQNRGFVTICMGNPEYKWDKIPIAEPVDPLNLDLHFEDNLGNIIFNPIALNIGNPHVVFLVDDPYKIDLEQIGPIIENHALFPKKVNVNLASVLSRSSLKLRVWERGAGITLACGTGACASVIAANYRKHCDKNVEVTLPGGKLNISIDDNEKIFMTGPAEYSFSGNLFND